MTISLPISIGTEKNRRGRYVIAGICFLLIFAIPYVYEMNMSYLADESSILQTVLRSIKELGYFERSLISGMMLLIAALCGIENRKIKLQFNTITLYLWVMMNITFIVSGLFHDIQEGFLFSQIVIFITIPLFYIGWMQSGKTRELYTIMSFSVVLLTLITTIICMIWFPTGELYLTYLTDKGTWMNKAVSTITNDFRYMGTTFNPSRVAHFTTPGAICSMYLIYVWKGWRKILPAITLGFSISLAFMAVSRAAVISILLAGIGFAVIIFKKKKNWKSIIAVIVIISVSASSCYYVISRGEDKLNVFSNSIIASKVYASEPKEEEDEVEEKLSVIGERFQISGTLNKITSGRIVIWLTFLEKLNISGHDYRYYYPLRVKDTESNNYFFFSYPHNVVLDYAYRCGIFTGVLFLLLELLLLLFCLRTLFSRGNNIGDGAVFTIVGGLAFFVTSNVESVDHVFTRIILVVFYMALIPLFAPKQN